MQLRFIHEGFSIGTGSHDWEREFMAGGQPHSDRDRFEAQIKGQALYFTDHDNPHDVVKVVPALAAKNLEHYVDSRRLTSFRGGKIYYAFKTIVADEFRSQAHGSVMGAIDAALEYCPPATTSAELFDMARREQRQNPQSAQMLQQAGMQVDHIYDMYGRSRPHKQNFTLGQARAVVVGTSNRGYVVELAYEFARRLKNPTPADMPIVQKFLELTAQQFRKLAGTTGSNMPLYDYVVAPESSGKFNGWLAHYLCQETGAQFITVNKLQAKDVRVDRDELLARARNLEPASHEVGHGQYKLNLKGGKVTRMFDDPRQDNREAFANAWADNEAEKWQNVLSGLRPDQKPQIKHSAPPDKRRYLKMFDKAGAEAAQGKEVLLVDDNVAGGGTIELVHRILTSLSPQPTRIDVFVPLLIQDRLHDES